ncbi:unnamed protein product [Phytophthora fragariaefolia]|uniref:Unnamed protein product n=1 Tax=Phytophthora fragariaefolia TaxID=1490495 RepID=A0A9W6Y8N1_9STRA|nr:unnamed protein product [Phytophthora fragariaefolia]
MTSCGISTDELLALLGEDAHWEANSAPLEVDAVEDLQARKKAKHRAAMVQVRLAKKQERKKLVDEHRRLKKQMKTLVDSVRDAAECSSGREGGAFDELRELVVGREALQKQNVALRKEIQRHEKFQSVLQETREGGVEAEESMPAPLHGGAGWRVHFENDEPSFFFHPLTCSEFDDTMEHFDKELKHRETTLSTVGSFFGWVVQKAPLVSAADGKSLLTRTRVSKRLRSSLDLHTEISYTKQKDLIPVVVTPMGWGLQQRPIVYSSAARV